MIDYVLTFEEVLFFATALKMKNIFGLDFHKKDVDLSQIDIHRVKESLCYKNYITIIDENHIDIDEKLYQIFKVWNKPEKILVMFGQECDEMEPKQIISIKGNLAIKIKIDEENYRLDLYNNLDEFKLVFQNELKLHDNVELDNQLYMILSGDKFESLLNLFENQKVTEVEKEFSRCGLKSNVGINLLKLVIQNSHNYLVMIDNIKNKKSIIKMYVDDKNQYIFKLTMNEGVQKVVVSNQISEESIKSILYV